MSLAKAPSIPHLTKVVRMTTPALSHYITFRWFAQTNDRGQITYYAYLYGNALYSWGPYHLLLAAQRLALHQDISPIYHLSVLISQYQHNTICVYYECIVHLFSICLTLVWLQWYVIDYNVIYLKHLLFNHI